MIDLIKEFFSTQIKISGEELPVNMLQLILRFVLPVIILVVTYKLIILYLYKSLKKTSLTDETKKRTIKYIRILFRVVILVSFMVIIDKLLGDEVASYMKLVLSVLNEPFFVTGTTSISLVTVFMMLPLFYFSSWLGKMAYRLFDTSFIETAHIGEEKKFTIAKLVRYGVTIMTLLIGLSIIGINMSSIAVMFGVLVIGLGFGLQNLVANLFAGFVIIITRPVKEGDFINVGENRGVITKINTISTIITTLMNETIIVPNSLLISDVIYNDTYSDKNMVIKNTVTVSYDSDIDMVRSILMGVAMKNPYFKSDTEADARVLNFGSSGIEMVLYSTINDVKDRGLATAWNNLEIWRELKANKIEIPISQMDVRIKSGNQRQTGDV